MSSRRTALLLFGLLASGGLAAGTVLVRPAVAATAALFEGLGILELLRPTDLVGDGASPADLYLLALDPKGAPIVGWKVKLTVTGGTATELVEVGGGLYRFTFTATATDSPTTATAELRGKMPTREAFSQQWTFPVAPPRNRVLKVAVNPTELTLGVDKTANVSFTVTGGDPRTLAAVKLVAVAAPGALTTQTNLGGGKYDALYTAPTGATAQVALVTAVDGGDASRGYAAVVIPLAARLDQVVKVAPKAQVLLKVAGRDFGPVPADAKGRAKVPIVVPPGVTNATLVEVKPDGAVSEAPLDLKIPETRRIALFPTAAALPADGRVQVAVRAIVVTPEGKPDEAAQVEFAVPSGKVGPARHEGGGIYVATWTPAFGNAVAQAPLTVKLTGASALQADSRPVNLVPVRPSTIALSADPATLPAGATAVTVLAKVTGPDDAALAARTLAFTANGAKLQGVVDQKDGTYKATFATTGKGPVEVTARATTQSLGNPLARIVIVPARETLPPDGLSSAMLTVVTVDDYGYPVPGTEVELRLLSGDGTMPTTVTTNADGVAQVYYTAGRKNGFVGIEAVAGDRSAGVSLVQAPAGFTLVDLPVATGTVTGALAAEVAAGMAAIRIERGG